MSFPFINKPLRTDESFKARSDIQHHKYDSVAEKIISMISQLPIDPMHCIYKGVMGKLLQLWIFKLKIIKKRHKIQINERLKILAANQPYELARTIRPLEEVNYFKSSELRTLTLYTGPIVFKNILPEDMYNNFLMFSYATRIFTHPNNAEFYNIGEDASKKFFKGFLKLYGVENCVYNIHIFTHIADECRRHGPCESFSCFEYESFLYSVKLLIHNPKNPIVQISNRVKEKLLTFSTATLRKVQIKKDELTEKIN
jgi:hypothetical protein